MCPGDVHDLNPLTLLPLYNRDGGLEATVDREAGVMVCREAGDVYATAEPAAAFHQRTAFCLDIHNEVRRPSRTARPKAMPAAPPVLHAAGWLEH